MRNTTEIIIKTPEQITGIRAACALNASILDYIEPYIVPGISTLELDQIANAYVVGKGGKSACIDYLSNNKWGK